MQSINPIQPDLTDTNSLQLVALEQLSSGITRANLHINGVDKEGPVHETSKGMMGKVGKYSTRRSVLRGTPRGTPNRSVCIYKAKNCLPHIEALHCESQCVAHTFDSALRVIILVMSRAKV